MFVSRSALSLVVCSFLTVIVPDNDSLIAQQFQTQQYQTQQPDQAELIYFYDESENRDQSSAEAIRVATESGFRIREVAAKRFPNLVKMFQIRRLPSLVLLRRNRLNDRHEGRFGFPRIREMFAKMRDNRQARRERIREMIAGSGRINRTDAPSTRLPSTSPPIAPRYIQTSANSNAGSNGSAAARIPKPLDRGGRFAVAHRPSLAEQTAFNATVRLRVVDPSGTSHGTGTIIHSQGLDALVLTCGHIFRESKGRGRIEADVLFPEGATTVTGKLISYDSRAHDIALLTLRTHKNIPPVKVAGRKDSLIKFEEVFTVGCDKGRSPTIRRSHYKRKATYDGVEKHDVYGRPIDGRSGGGLFNQRGELIGVCNAAAVHADEGIYSGLKTIYHQLTQSHLVHLFDESKVESLAATRRAPQLPNSATRQIASRFEALPATVQSKQPSNHQWQSVQNRVQPQREAATVGSVHSSRGNQLSKQASSTTNQPKIPRFQLANHL